VSNGVASVSFTHEIDRFVGESMLTLRKPCCGEMTVNAFMSFLKLLVNYRIKARSSLVGLDMGGLKHDLKSIALKEKPHA
jgi:hypothetical protein